MATATFHVLIVIGNQICLIQSKVYMATATFHVLMHIQFPFFKHKLKSPCKESDNLFRSNRLLSTAAILILLLSTAATTTNNPFSARCNSDSNFLLPPPRPQTNTFLSAGHSPDLNPPNETTSSPSPTHFNSSLPPLPPPQQPPTGGRSVSDLNPSPAPTDADAAISNEISVETDTDTPNSKRLKRMKGGLKEMMCEEDLLHDEELKIGATQDMPDIDGSQDIPNDTSTVAHGSSYLKVDEMGEGSSKQLNFDHCKLTGEAPGILYTCVGSKRSVEETQTGSPIPEQHSNSSENAPHKQHPPSFCVSDSPKTLKSSPLPSQDLPTSGLQVSELEMKTKELTNKVAMAEEKKVDEVGE